MKIYKNSIYITGALTIITFGGSLVLHYKFPSREGEFWCNILLGIFGGSILTLISSIIGYKVERKRVLEKFCYYTDKILKQVNQYQLNMTSEEKIDFLLEYADSDKIEWDSCLRDIDFVFDFRRKNFKYIYNSIYVPLLELQNAVRRHYWNFKWYKDGTGKNHEAIKGFLAEIEALILNKTEESIDGEVDKNGSTKRMVVTSVSNRLVEKINEELSGKYYKLMYKKKRSEVKK